MSTSIYDDPEIEVKPTSTEIRVAELKAIVANESELQDQSAKAKESIKQLDDAIRTTRHEMESVYKRDLERATAPLNEQFRKAQSAQYDVAMKLREITLAKDELIQLSPLSARLNTLKEKLFRAHLDDNSNPIRPVLLEEIEKWELGNIIHEPNQERASSKRRELKRHDETIADIQSEINDLKKQIGIAP